MRITSTPLADGDAGVSVISFLAQLVWGPCDDGQHVVNFSPGGCSSICKTSKDMA